MLAGTAVPHVAARVPSRQQELGQEGFDLPAVTDKPLAEVIKCWPKTGVIINQDLRSFSDTML